MGYSFPLTNIFQRGWNHQPDKQQPPTSINNWWHYSWWWFSTTTVIILVDCLEHFGTWIFWFSIYREFHHPNWRTHIFQRGRYTTNQYMVLRCFFLMGSTRVKGWGTEAGLRSPIPIIHWKVPPWQTMKSTWHDRFTQSPSCFWWW